MVPARSSPLRKIEAKIPQPAAPRRAALTSTSVVNLAIYACLSRPAFFKNRYICHYFPNPRNGSALALWARHALSGHYFPVYLPVYLWARQHLFWPLFRAIWIYVWLVFCLSFAYFL